MATYSKLYRVIWKDPTFQLYPPQKKLAFIYLWSNDSVRPSGIYPLTFQTMRNETRIQYRTIERLLREGQLKNISYDPEYQFVFVHRFMQYHPGGNPKAVRKSVIKDYELTYKSPLWTLFFFLYPKYADIPPTVGQPLAKGSICPSISISISRSISNSIEPLGNGSKSLQQQEFKTRLEEVRKKNPDLATIIETAKNAGGGR